MGRTTPPWWWNKYFDPISEFKYSWKTRTALRRMGRVVLSKFGPTDWKVKEVPVNWHRRQVFLPHLWCRFLLRAHDNRAHKQTQCVNKQRKPKHPSFSTWGQECEDISVRLWSKHTRVYHLPLCDADDVISLTVASSWERKLSCLFVNL